MKTALNSEELNLIKLAKEYSDEAKARTLLEHLRWPNGPICPHCKNAGKDKKIYALTPKADSKRPARQGLYKCGACREQFTVKVGTIFEDSHLPIATWLQAIFILCSSKKAMSAHQLHRMLGITYKSAWFMAHRIRYAMAPTDPKPLKGIVEVDETFVGGKLPRAKRNVNKTPVMALVERQGNIRTRIVANVTSHNVRKVLTECVDKTATVNTDEGAHFRGETLRGWARHDRVNHSKFEYSRTNQDGTTSGVNSAESFFSLLKRGITGAWHHVSKEHLAKYADEFAFRWNTRKSTDGERMEVFIPMVEGKRLTYKQAA